MKLRAVIVDDEPLARQVLREMLATEPGVEPQVEVVAECANGFEAVKAVAELRPDLLLLDIQMPKLDGFEVLELIQSQGTRRERDYERLDGRSAGLGLAGPQAGASMSGTPAEPARAPFKRGRAGGQGPAPIDAGREVAVVFVTAHDQHALRAFEVHAVDFLLKPFSRERLRTALQRALERRQPPPSGAALAAAAHPGFKQRLAVRDGAKVTIIPVTQLDYAQAQDDYVALVSAGKQHLKQQTIASLEAELDPEQFVRIHRSFIVRLEAIVRIEASSACVPTSRRSASLAPQGSQAGASTSGTRGVAAQGPAPSKAADGHVLVLASGQRLPVSRAGYARLRERL